MGHTVLSDFLKSSRRISATGILVLLSWLGCSRSWAQPSGTELVSQIATLESATALGESTAPLVSGDGRFVAFQSTASNLVTNDANGALMDVFVRDIASRQVLLVSIRTNGGSGNGPSGAPSISHDGQVVAFDSTADNLVPNDTNGVADVFVRDLVRQSTRLVSRGADGVSANAPSGAPRLTADGRYVFFESRATNLVPGFANGFMSLYRSDLITGEVVPVNEPATNLLSKSWSPAANDAGDKVAYLNLSASLSSTSPDLSRHTLVVRDLASGLSQVLNSAAVFPPGAKGVSPAPQLSGDGRVAVFLASTTQTAPTGGVYRLELSQGTAELLAPDLNTLLPLRRGGIVELFVNRDGTLVIFEASARNVSPGAPEAVFAWEASTLKTSLISTNRVMIAELSELQPFGQLAAVSANGRFVAWLGFDQSGITWPSNEPLQLLVQDRLNGETRRITRTKTGAPSMASTEFPAASFSADGWFLAFQSIAPDMAEGDGNQSNDVFLYDWESDQLELISRRSEALPSRTHPGLSFAGPNSVSSDGRLVVFVSTVRGLTPEDTQSVLNVFVRDLVTSSNRLISVSEVGAPANGACQQAVISADGRWAAFTSRASNLAANDTNQVEDVFLSDLQNHNVYLVSRNQEGSASGNGFSSSPAISPDGSRVVFVSSASDLAADDVNRMQDIFVFDRLSNSVRLVSATPDARSGAGSSYNPTLSPDGAWIVFESTARDLLADVFSSVPQVYAWRVSDGTLRHLTREFSNLRSPLPRALAFSGDSKVVVFEVLPPVPSSGGTDFLLHDLAASETVALVSGASAPALDFGGRRVAYATPARAPLTSQIALLDRGTGATNLISVGVSDSGRANGRSSSPLITPDGRFVVFASRASDLVRDDDDSATDIFVRDTQLNTTLLLSRGSTPRLGTAISALPILGRDGRTVVFTSFASDLVAEDLNEQADLFVVKLPGPESGFRILTISNVSTGEITLVWAARAGPSYQVEWTEAITGPWQPLNVPVRIENEQGSAIDASATGRPARFYRVVETTP